MFTKRKLVFFIAGSALLMFFGYINNIKETSEFQPARLLDFSDAINIFLLNMTVSVFWILLSVTGLSIPFIAKFIYGIGQAGSLSENPASYYLSSLTHGIGELIVCYIIADFSIKHLYILFLLITDKVTSEKLKAFYVHTIKKTLPLCMVLLFISSLLEVYLSNRIYYHLSIGI